MRQPAAVLTSLATPVDAGRRRDPGGRGGRIGFTGKLLDFAFHLGRVVNRCSKLRLPKRRSGLYKSPFPEVLGDNPMQQQTPNYPLSIALAAGAVNTALLN